MATAAERTRNLRLGTGVVSLPYHHPYMVANRMVPPGSPHPRARDAGGWARRAGVGCLHVSASIRRDNGR